jgi:hypothetical protein
MRDAADPNNWPQCNLRGVHMDEKEYRESRLDNQIGWYDRKSGRHKRLYMLFKVLEVIFAASIPVLLAVSELFDDVPDLPLVLRGLAAAFGAGVAILSGVLGIGKFQENWMAYRTTCEMLRHEKYFYEMGCGPYKDPAGRVCLLVQRVEELISQENTNWQQHMEEAKKNDTTPPPNTPAT